MTIDISQADTTKYNFNSIQEIKSHSSILYNQRMAILFYILDMKALGMHKNKTVDSLYDVYSVIRQIFKNMRMLIRYNDMVRVQLNLETKDRGVYTIDIAMSVIDKMLKNCEEQGFTQRKMYIIIQELDNVEMLIKDILQYFSYFVRPDFSQKPDVEVATSKYKEIADQKTVEELRAIVGKKNMVDFEALGSERITLEDNRIEYDPIVDGDLSEYEDEDEDLYFEEEQTEQDEDEEYK